MDALSIVQSSLATLKKLKVLNEKIKNANYVNLIADLNISLADLKMKIVELQEENAKLKTLVSASSNDLTIRNSLELIDSVYYLKEPIDGRPKGPYCTRCFDADKKLILLATLKAPFDDFGKYQCQNCQGIF